MPILSGPRPMARCRSARPAWIRCRPVRAGAVTIAITTPAVEIQQRFDSLLAAMPDGSESDDESRVVDVRVGLLQPRGPSSPGAVCDLWLDGQQVLSFAWIWACEDKVLGWLNEWALDSEPERLHLHAGLISKEGAGVLVVGPKGSGKSTLVSHLVRSGWVYHTDEMVGFEPHRPLVARSFARPPTLKPGAWPLFADLPSVSDEECWRFADRLHIPPGELGPLPTVESTVVRAIVFVSQGDTLEFSPIGPSKAAELCVADALDLGRIGASGMRALVDLVTGAHLFQLRLHGLDGTASLLSRLLELPSVEGATPAWELTPVDESARAEGVDDLVFTPTAAIAPDTRVWRAGRTFSWGLPDGAVVFDPSGGTVARLDPSGGEVWRSLDGRTAAELANQLSGGASARLGEAREGITAFFRELRTARLVEVRPS